MTAHGPEGAGGGRLGVLGALVLDTIRRPGTGEPVEAPGGVTYALAAFEARPPAGWEAVPLVKVGADARDVADALLSRLDSVATTEGVLTVPEPNNRVELVYDGRGDRTERLTGGVPGWGWEELSPLLGGCDALYVNLVAGWEVDLACARRLRGSVPGPVYCDLHSLFLDRSGDGVRRPRVPDAWRGWVRCFDYLQLNRDELGALADEADEEPASLARRLVADAGPRALFVTLGAEGAAWVARGAAPRPGEDGGSAGRGRGDGPGLRTGRAAPPRRVEDGDPTGCGDVWGMACFGALLEGADAPSAVARANELASRNAARSGGLGLLAPSAGSTGPDEGGPGRRRPVGREDGTERPGGGPR